MGDNSTRIRVIGEDQFSGVLKDAQKAVQGLTGGVSLASSFIAGMGMGAGKLALEAIASGFRELTEAIVGAPEAMVNANRDWETASTQFYVLLGRNWDNVKARLSELEDFAIATPFELDEVVEADRLMQVFGLHASNAADRWGMAGSDIRTVIGDTAAGAKTSYNELAEWVGRFAAGDTGRAIRRFEQLGVTTRAELKAMGLEFDKAQKLVSPVDEAMTTLLATMQRKYGGLMEIQSKSLAGMESNLKDWGGRQLRIWGEPVFDLYKDGVTGLWQFLQSEGVGQLMAAGQSLWAAGVGWVRDLVGDLGAHFGGLARDLFYWGANIIDQFAAGIAGSDAVATALQSVGMEIEKWLVPGSPPKLLPELTTWGTGAAEAWLEGWSGATPRIGPELAAIGDALAPYLREIDLGGTVAPGAIREQLGVPGADLEKYVRAYERMHLATRGVSEAQQELADAEATGDQGAIDAAKKKLGLAQTEETQANAAMRAEQRRISDKLTAEHKLLEAMRAQTKAIADRSTAEEEAARKKAEREAEAERKAREQAFLNYRLAVAGTASGQIPIWEEELAKAAKDSSEWWEIQTRLVNLRRKAAEEQGESIGAAFTDSYTAAVKDGSEETSVAKIDWAGIGQSIGGAILDGLASSAKKIPGKMLEWSRQLHLWAVSTETQTWAAAAGLNLGRSIADGIKFFFGLDTSRVKIGEGILEGIAQAVYNIGASIVELGVAFGQGIVEGIAKGLLNEETFNLWKDTGVFDWKGTLEKYGGLNYNGFASGTSYAPGGWALVGERGPELVNLPRGSQVTPANETRQALSGTTVHVHPGAIVLNIANGNAREVQRGVVGALRQIGMPA